jgi:hypothetical protein
VARKRFAFVRALWAFASSGQRMWLVPVVALLLLVSLLALAGALAPYAAFLYPL